MTEKESIQCDAACPISEFHFSVEIFGVGKICCMEVSGLDSGYEKFEYHSGDMPDFARVRMPGLRKSGDVTLKRVMFKDNKSIRNWIDQVRMNVIRRTRVTVALLDDNGAPVQSWEISNAWPKKYSEWEQFRPEDDSVFMETIVLAHEGVIPITASS